MHLFCCMQWVINSVECQLITIVGDAYNSFKTQLWSTLDEEISLKDCDIYRCGIVYIQIEKLICSYTRGGCPQNVCNATGEE